MNKRGQITIFIIIAIIIIGAIGLYFSLRGGLTTSRPYSPQTEQIYLFVEECIEDTGRDAVYWIGQNGGYFFPPELSTKTGIPYYYSNGRNYMPYKEEVEEEISKYTEENLDFCLNDFVDFPEFNISQREIKTETKILDNKIILNIEYPLTITKGDSTSIIRNFENIGVSTRLGLVYNAVGKIILDQLNHKDICLSCISNIAGENDLAIDMTNTEEGLIFTVRDDSPINEFPLEWIFANKYE